MSTSAMAILTKSTAVAVRPDTLGRLTQHNPLHVVRWSDPVVDALGHDPPQRLRRDLLAGPLRWLIGPGSTTVAW